MPVSVMAATTNKATLKIGDLVEVDGRRYELVSGRPGEVALEPAIGKTVDEILAERGARLATPEEFEQLFGDLPADDEG